MVANLDDDGKIRPKPRDRVREICAVGVPMLCMQGASRLWVADVSPSEKWLTFTSLADNNIVSIVCDGESNLGDLFVIANSSHVCRVPLLVGAAYEVTSDGDIEDVSASDSRVQITESRGRRYYVEFPLSMSVSQSEANLSHYEVSVGPVDVGAEFVSVTGGCCTNYFDESLLVWMCGGDCACGGTGGHGIAVAAVWEGYQKLFWDLCYCPCRPAEVDEDSTNTVGGVTLSIPDTIFENEDNDFEEDPLYTDFGSPRIDDDDVASCRISTGGNAGVLTFNGFTGFSGYALTRQHPEPLNPNATEMLGGETFEMGNGHATLFPFFMHASIYSGSYKQARIGFTWAVADGGTEVLHKRFTVARPIVEPICSETTNVVENGVEHSYVVNPCGVGVGKDAYFRIQVLPNDYPDEKIVWSNETAGVVDFVGGNTGRAVTVRGYSPGTTHLTIHIGDSPSDPPHFPLKVLTNRVFHVKPWVGRRQQQGHNGRL